MAGQAVGAPLIGLTTTNQLHTFDSATPGNGSTAVNITGLGVNEQILGIDLRPANQTVYGLGSLGRLYTINPGTGAATLVGALAADPADGTNPFTALSGTSFGVDFNPAVDRLRITTNSGQNLRINAANGLTTTDAALNPGAPSIVGSAYDNNDTDPGTGTTLYDIDSATDSLYTQNPPNDGTLVFVGALGVDTNGVVGFEIQNVNTAFASLTNDLNGKSSLYSINLANGAASLIGAFGIGGNPAIAPPLLDITSAPIPEPATAVLMLSGLFGMALRRR
ncbi:MAG: DUF4394 domain-containing protein [Anaerolineae bacterium]|nr:DUF4394 domain-containing protein [Phycisphaerae bacterium]